MDQPVALIGPPGAGKTTVGRAAALLLGWQFVDLDERVAAATKRSVPEIFAEEGEASFRQYESRELIKCLQTPRTMIACGGGVVLSPQNVDLLRESATVVYLEVPVEVLLERLNDGGPRHRPLLEGLSSNGVSILIDTRLPLYRKAAHLTVDASRAPQDVAREIARVVLR